MKVFLVLFKENGAYGHAHFDSVWASRESAQEEADKQNSYFLSFHHYVREEEAQ